MTEINKEKLMSEIVDVLRQKTKDYPKHVDSDLVHLDMGELASFEAIFNLLYATSQISDEAKNINISFRKELEGAHKILEDNLEIVFKRMII